MVKIRTDRKYIWTLPLHWWTQDVLSRSSGSRRPCGSTMNTVSSSPSNDELQATMAFSFTGCASIAVITAARDVIANDRPGQAAAGRESQERKGREVMAYQRAPQLLALQRGRGSGSHAGQRFLLHMNWGSVKGSSLVVCVNLTPKPGQDLFANLEAQGGTEELQFDEA